MKENERIRAEEIPVLVEDQLLKQIKDLYEDVITTTKTKREGREKITRQFVVKCAKELSLPEDKVRSIVDLVIERTKWIKEIEELDEEVEDELEDVK